jgi:hypothetical protein
MIMTEGPNTGSFAKKAHSTKMNDTMIFIMVALLLMMLLPGSRIAGYSMATIVTPKKINHFYPNMVCPMDDRRP